MFNALAAFVRRTWAALPAWGWGVCGALLLLGWTFSGLAYQYANQLERETLQSQLSREVDVAVEELDNRLRSHEQLLLAAAAFLERAPDIRSEGWSQFAHSVKLADRYPGMVGLGYAPWQPPRAPLALWESMTVRSPVATGFDLFGEERRRQALAQARDSGQATMTGALSLIVPDVAQRRHGTVLYVPVYRLGQPHDTPEQRRQALQGWVFSPYLLDQFMAVVDQHVPDIALEIYDGREQATAKLLYHARRDQLLALTQPATFDVRRATLVGQREWVLRFVTLPRWDAAHVHRTSLLYLIGGIFLTLAAVGLLAFLIGHRAHALRLVQQATQALGSSEAKYKQLVEAQSDLIAVIALDGTLRYVNTACARFFGQEPEVLIGQCLYDLVLSSDPDPIRLHVAQLLEHRLIGTTELQIPDAQGRVRWVAWTSTLQESADDAHLQVHLVGRDMTDRHELESQLKDREQRYRGLFEHVQAGFALNEVILDEQGLVQDFRFLAANEAFERLTGWRAADILGRTIRELGLVDPDELELWVKSFGKVALGRGNLQFERLSKTFGRWLDVVVYRPAPLQFALMLHDATERHRALEAQRAQSEAEAESRAKTLFLANMSHEIRTPLNAVLGCAQIGLRDHAGDDSGALFQRIRDAGRHLLGVVNDILDFAKVESGKVDVDARPCNLSVVAHEALDMVRDRAHAKRLDLLCEVDESAPAWVSTDPMRLAQILVNLLSNAVKFTQKGSVRLTIGVHDDRVRVSVIDTGVGMSEDQMARVFSPFEQADKSITRQFGGTGLGLTISANLAELLGGTLTVQSQLGQGATFTLSWPLVVAEPGEAAPLKEALPPDVLRGLRVLVVDDVEVNRIIIDDLLTHRGASVVMAADGQEALDVVARSGGEPFHVVLMDVQMPVMDGITAAERLRQMSPQLPVMALTAHAFAQERARCLAVGMVDHINKPVDEGDLVKAVARCCGITWVDDASHAAVASVQSTPSSSAAEARVSDLDWGGLVGLYGKKPGLLQRAIQSVLSHNQDTANKLRDAVAQRDWDTLVFVAHSLKGVAGNIRAPQLRELASQTEQAGRRHDDDAYSLAMSLADGLEQVLSQLSSQLNARMSVTS